MTMSFSQELGFHDSATPLVASWGEGEETIFCPAMLFLVSKPTSSSTGATRSRMVDWLVLSLDRPDHPPTCGDFYLIRPSAETARPAPV